MGIQKLKFSTGMSKKTIALIIIIGICAFTIVGLLIYYQDSNQIIIDVEPIPSDSDDETPDDTDPDPDPDPEPEPEVPPEFNVLLHQSYSNDSDISFDQDGGSISFPQPTNTDFNSTYSEIGLKNLEVNGYTLVEDHGLTTASGHQAGSNPLVASFEIPSDCLLESVSVNVRSTEIVRFWVLSAIDDGGIIKPTTLDQNLTTVDYDTGETSLLDLNLQIDPNFELNSSMTINNTFFLGISHVGSWYARWAYNETVDDQLNYIDNAGSWFVKNADYSFNITFAPISDEIVEEHGLTTNADNAASQGQPLLASFTLENTAIITSISSYINTNYEVRFWIFASEWDGVKSIPTSDLTSNLTVISKDTSNAGPPSKIWLTINDLIVLDCDMTENNTFFLGMDNFGTAPVLQWARDTSSSVQYNYKWSGSSWNIMNADYTFNITYISLDSLGLAINDESFNGTIWQSGNVHSEFNISATWANTTFDVDYMQINFTKSYIPETETLATSDTEYYRIRISLDQFDADFENHYIRLTIPDNYTITYVYYDPRLPESEPIEYELSGVYVTISGFDLENNAIDFYFPRRDEE